MDRRLFFKTLITPIIVSVTGLSIFQSRMSHSQILEILREDMKHSMDSYRYELNKLAFTQGWK